MYEILNILVGSACDRHCEYCLQSSQNTLANKKADPEKFALKLKQFLHESPRNIAYWGGEPMLYLEQIQTIHSILPEPVKQSTITTHGRSLNQDYLKWANSESKIWTVISLHDLNFSEKQLNLIMQLKNMSMSTIIYKGHETLETEEDFFWKIYKKYKIFPRICAHFLRANDSCDARFYMDKGAIDKYLAYMNFMVQRANNYDIFALWICKQFCFEHKKRSNFAFGPMCGRPEILSVDMHGNQYICHHNYSKNNIKGNIFNSKFIPILDIKLANPYKFFNTKECQECELIAQCKGNCYVSNTHEIDCYFMKEREKLYQFIQKRLFK